MNPSRLVLISAFLLVSVAVTLAVVLPVISGNVAVGTRDFIAILNGWNEVPSVVSTGIGWTMISISPDGRSITFEMRYNGIRDVTMAHIHLGKDGHIGAVAVWLCGGPRPPCPPSPGTVTGTITADDVLGIPAQGLSRGDLASLIAAIRNGAAYVNVHTTAFPAGEIRGQFRPLGTP
ncbi:MAG: CHRD domain-containing protein [Aigarchaeota archaeon]|nr:CHRD domain-containing protein [Aigarchaeota archaeon]MDW8092222.1 CHRD domain-containing protein [Nitrososphaerota archaeon]